MRRAKIAFMTEGKLVMIGVDVGTAIDGEAKIQARMATGPRHGLHCAEFLEGQERTLFRSSARTIPFDITIVQGDALGYSL